MTAGEPGPAGGIHYRPDIDGLRAVAVLAVIGFHYFPHLVTGGYVGVDIFFVISGFLITNIILIDLDRDRFSFRNFYARRVRRIFPALLLVLAAVLAFGWRALFSFELETLGKHVFGGAAFMANILYWQESGYFDPASFSKPLLHLWSLGIEEQFYLLFPGLLYLSRKFKLKAVYVIGILLALSFFYNYALYKQREVAADFYSPLTRFWELMIGAVLAAVGRNRAEFRTRPENKADSDGRAIATITSALGCILLFIAIFLFRERTAYPGHWALTPTMGAALVILAGSKGWFNRRLLSAKWLVAIGLISYPLYLWHWPLFSFPYIINGARPDPLVRIGALAVSLALAALTYKLVERPLRFGPGARRLKTGLLAALMIIMGALGLYAKSSHGFPERSHMLSYKPYESYERMPEFLSKLTRQHEGCLLYAPEMPSDSYCKFRDEGSGFTVAVIGDSHALAAYPGLAKLNSTLGYNTVLLAGSGLPPFLGLERAGATKARREHEAKLINTIINLAITKNDIRKVFIIIHGSAYFTGQSVSGYKLVEGDIVTQANFAESLNKTVEKLAEAGKEVFVVMELPMAKDNLAYHVPRPFRRVKPPPSPVYKHEVVERQNDYKRILDNLGKATIIDPADAFCPEEECLAYSPAGLPFYIDDNHLNALGSDFLAERVLKKYLTPAEH